MNVEDTTWDRTFAAVDSSGSIKITNEFITLVVSVFNPVAGPDDLKDVHFCLAFRMDPVRV